MPAGQVDLYFKTDLSAFLNQKLQAEVTQFDAHAKNLIVSRRNVLEREKEEAKAEDDRGDRRRADRAAARCAA